MDKETREDYEVLRFFFETYPKAVRLMYLWLDYVADDQRVTDLEKMKTFVRLYTPEPDPEKAFAEIENRLGQIDAQKEFLLLPNEN
jgi:hypothetical protein